jgi:hypothetical protein
MDGSKCFPKRQMFLIHNEYHHLRTKTERKAIWRLAEHVASFNSRSRTDDR